MIVPTITLVAYICTINANIRLCQEVEVPTEQMAYGKVYDPQTNETFEPIIVPGMKYGACAEGESFKQAQDWLALQQQYDHWYVQGVKCVVGKYVPSKRA